MSTSGLLESDPCRDHRLAAQARDAARPDRTILLPEPQMSFEKFQDPLPAWMAMERVEVRIMPDPGPDAGIGRGEQPLEEIERLIVFAQCGVETCDIVAG